MISRRQFFASAGALALGVFSLTGCSNSSASNSASSGPATAATAVKEANEKKYADHSSQAKIADGKVILVDDEACTIEVKEIKLESGSPSITFRVKNKTDVYLSADLNGYIDDEKWRPGTHGNPTIEPGKAATVDYLDFYKHQLKSTADFAKLNGSFDIKLLNKVSDSSYDYVSGYNAKFEMPAGAIEALK